METDALLHMVRDFFQISQVGIGNNNIFHFMASGSDGFFLQAADGQNLAREAELSGHGQVGFDFQTCGQGEQGRRHGDAR